MVDHHGYDPWSLANQASVLHWTNDPCKYKVGRNARI